MANRSSGDEKQKPAAELHADRAIALTQSLLNSGKISRTAAHELFEALGHIPKGDVLPEGATPRADFFTWVAARLGSMLAAIGASLAGTWLHQTQKPQKSGKSTAGAENSGDVTHPHVGGIDSLLSLEALTETLKPLFNEYVWWFIALVLVISGSIMGIREAWLRFEGILRPFTILFAFFVYHMLFLGLGIFIHRKSAGTGKMLLLIAGA